MGLGTGGAGCGCGDVTTGGGRAPLTPVLAESTRLAGIISSTGVSSGFSRDQKNAGPANKITSSSR
jgi:hypothetical protein